MFGDDDWFALGGVDGFAELLVQLYERYAHWHVLDWSHHNVNLKEMTSEAGAAFIGRTADRRATNDEGDGAHRAMTAAQFDLERQIAQLEQRPRALDTERLQLTGALP